MQTAIRSCAAAYVLQCPELTQDGNKLHLFSLPVIILDTVMSQALMQADTAVPWWPLTRLLTSKLAVRMYNRQVMFCICAACCCSTLHIVRLLYISVWLASVHCLSWRALRPRFPRLCTCHLLGPFKVLYV
jgi:hypothetical protein